ncbi:haloalkane dehalogenase [Nocardia sp. NPDC050406]|uniref:haloalkane dehalogenase n=1 Tax=Nocardia sp. NPDC050406 TaxID=3364318 RepID=UPI0037A55BBC
MPIVDTLDSTMNYREQGEGAPIVFLHGNPTSSYIWRKVMGFGRLPGRLLAPDLIGMGESGKPDIDYTYADQIRYLDAWFDALGVEDAVLVGHDWGGTLAFDWASRHPERVRGIAFTEAIVKPLEWEELPPPARELFHAIKTPGVGEEMVLDQNAFLDPGVPATVVGGLSAEDMATYLAPYPTPASRVPILQWARANPLGGEPADVAERIAGLDAWLAASHELPKLLLTFEPGPGTTMGPELIQWCVDTIAALEVDKLGLAGHQTPEDQPEAIAESLAGWLTRHELLDRG